ncbi:MAG: hypothetical protein AAFQ44_06695, partial [Pseudomonadota bacterium]
GQGRENAKTYLRENPDIARTVEGKIRQNAGLLDDLLLGEPEPEDDIEVDEDGVIIEETPPARSAGGKA